MAAAGSRSSEAEGDLLVSQVGVLQRDSEEDWRFLGQVKAPHQKRRAVMCVESAETQDCVSAPPLTSCMEQIMEAEDEKDIEELSFVPSAVSEPRWAILALERARNPICDLFAVGESVLGLFVLCCVSVAIPVIVLSSCWCGLCCIGSRNCGQGWAAMANKRTENIVDPG